MIIKQRFAVAVSILVLCGSYSGPLAQTVYPKGTTIWNPSLSRSGYTFIDAFDGTARLVGMLGGLVNTWSAPPNDSLLYKMPILQSPGHILAVHGPISVPGYFRARGSIVSEYDWAGNKVWEYAPGPTINIFPFGGFHHDLTRLDNGNTLLLASVLVSGTSISNNTLIDDCILEVNPAGTIVWAWFTWQHFEEFQFTDTAKSLISAMGGDWAHANAVSVVPANNLVGAEFKPGNLIISYRQLNTIVIVDKSTGAIVWKVGPGDSKTIGQHYPHMIPIGLAGAGNILAFDNGAAGGYPAVSREYSRVVEIDPQLKSLPWIYTAGRSGLQNWSFFSPFVSDAQRLRGGNTLITEGTKGRIFEITATGEIVWEYMSPFNETRLDFGVNVVDYDLYRAFRLPFYWPIFSVPKDGGV